MMLSRSLWYGALGLACAITSMQARAVEFGGTFSGTVSTVLLLPHTNNAPHPPSYYEGAPVFGSFAFNVPSPQLAYMDGPQAIYSDSAGSLSFSYTLKGVNYSFDSDLGGLPGGIQLFLFASAAGSPQSLTIASQSSQAYFELTGPPGSLYSGLDASTLHIDPAAAYTGRNSLISAQASATFYVDMAQVNFQPIQPVPEPTTAALFIVGGALLAWRLRRRPVDPQQAQRLDAPGQDAAAGSN
jgi:hypothetical protein